MPNFIQIQMALFSFMVRTIHIWIIVFSFDVSAGLSHADSLGLFSVCSQACGLKSKSNFVELLVIQCQADLARGHCSSLMTEHPEFSRLIKKCDLNSICSDFKDLQIKQYAACAEGYWNATHEFIDDLSDFVWNKPLELNQQLGHKLTYTIKNFYSWVARKNEKATRNKKLTETDSTEQVGSEIWYQNGLKKLKEMMSYVDNKITTNNQQYACFKELAKTEMDCYANGVVIDPITLAGAAFKLEKISHAGRSQKINFAAGEDLSTSNHQLKLWELRESGQTEKADQLAKKLTKSLNESPIVNVSEPLAGKSGAVILTLEDGTMGVWKRMSVRDSKNNGDRELAAYLIDQKLELNVVPIVVQRNYNGEKGTMQLFVKHAESQGLPKYPESLSLFDYLIAHRDRHNGNYFTVDGRQIAIDHGEAFVSMEWDKFLKNVPDETEKKIDAYLKQKKKTLELEKSLVALENDKKIDLYRTQRLAYQTGELNKSRSTERLLSIQTKNSISALLINRNTYRNLNRISNSEWKVMLKERLSVDEIEYFLRRKEDLIRSVEHAISVFGEEVLPAGPFSPIIRSQ